MSLVPCRACNHQVDTSALACPKCGATDPGKKLSRQQRNAIGFILQLIFWGTVLSMGALYVKNTVIPLAKQYLVKPPAHMFQPPSQSEQQ